MDRRLQEPFTLRKHDKLTWEINEFVIAAKLHHCHPPERHENKENWEKAMSKYECPTWNDVIDLLQKTIKGIDSCRIDPRKR